MVGQSIKNNHLNLYRLSSLHYPPYGAKAALAARILMGTLNQQQEGGHWCCF